MSIPSYLAHKTVHYKKKTSERGCSYKALSYVLLQSVDEVLSCRLQRGQCVSPTGSNEQIKRSIQLKNKRTDWRNAAKVCRVNKQVSHYGAMTEEELTDKKNFTKTIVYKS